MNTSLGPMRLTDLNELRAPSDCTMFSFSMSKEAQVPTKLNPIRFAVLYRNGRTSNAWGVRVKNTGDGYIYCRDNMKGQEVSLHASGKQHISIDPNSRSTANLTKKQFMNQWYQPDEGTATFRLVFPPWGIQLNEEQRDKFRSTWNENDIFIEGHHEFLTVVSFYIVNERARYQRKNKFPGFLLGELPLKIGTKLAITAEWEPEERFRVNIENALRQSPPEKNMIEHHLGQAIAACVTGNCGAPNSVFMVNFPIIYSDTIRQEPMSNTPD